MEVQTLCSPSANIIPMLTTELQLAGLTPSDADLFIELLEKTYEVYYNTNETYLDGASVPEILYILKEML